MKTFKKIIKYTCMPLAYLLMMPQDIISKMHNLGRKLRKYGE